MKQQKTSSIIFILSFCLVLFSCSKGSDTPAPAPIPAISVQDVSQPRTATATTMRFYFNADKTTRNEFSVNNKIEDETARPPGNYTAASGTVSIPANQTQAT